MKYKLACTVTRAEDYRLEFFFLIQQLSRRHQPESNANEVNVSNFAKTTI